LRSSSTGDEVVVRRDVAVVEGVVVAQSGQPPERMSSPRIEDSQSTTCRPPGTVNVWVLTMRISSLAAVAAASARAASTVAASQPAYSLANDTTYYGLKEDLTLEPFVIELGHIAVPTRPGLGCDIDPEKLRRYAVDC
jgi:hypothetical protein